MVADGRNGFQLIERVLEEAVDHAEPSTTVIRGTDHGV